jgi:integrase
MTQPRTKLTAAAIGRYRPAAKRREIADAGCPGLRLIVQPSGALSFALRFRKPNGVQAKLTLGPYDSTGEELKGDPVIGQPLTLAAARALATAINRERARGIDVVSERKAEKSRQAAATAHASANTFTAALREFFVDHKTRKGARPRRWREDAATLGMKFSPGADPAIVPPVIIHGGLADVWRDKPLSEIDGHAVFTVVDAARKSSAGRGRKTFAVLSSFFSWALRQRRIAANPCVGVYKPPPPPPRERVLSDEIVSFWRACDQIGAPYGALFRLLLLTGCRLREVGGMRRSELADGVWTIPGNRTKNGRGLTLTLPALALEIIGAVQSASGEFVFSTTGVRPVNGFGEAKRQLDAAMKPGEPWRLHDLRRTCASGMAALGIALPVTEKVLNHVSGSFAGVTGVYQRHDFKREMAEALQRWAAQVAGLVHGKPGNVVAMRRSKSNKVAGYAELKED